jgi:hypothetical protein
MKKSCRRNKLSIAIFGFTVRVKRMQENMRRHMSLRKESVFAELHIEKERVLT